MYDNKKQNKSIRLQVCSSWLKSVTAEIPFWFAFSSFLTQFRRPRQHVYGVMENLNTIQDSMKTVNKSLKF